MKNKSTLSFVRIALLTRTAIVCCTLFASGVVSLSAQSASVAPGDPISTADLPVTPNWKAAAEYAVVLATERVNAANVLALTNQKQSKTALYTGYDRMLAYMQADLQGNEPIDLIADNNFKRVTLETPADPSLNLMDPVEFKALYDALVIMLTE